MIDVFRIAKKSKSIDKIENFLQSLHKDVNAQSLRLDFLLHIVNVLKNEKMIEMIHDHIIQNFDRNHVYVC